MNAFYGRIAQVFAAIHRSQSSMAGAPAIGAVRLFGEKPQESKRQPRLLAGLRRLEDDPQCTDHEHHLNGSAP